MRFIGRALGLTGKGLHLFARASIRAIGILILLGVVISFATALGQGWYFGHCDQPLGVGCEVRHILGITMSRDGRENASQSGE